MKVFKSITQAKSGVPRLDFKRLGKPSRPSPASSVPVMQAITRDTMVFFVTKDKTIAMTAGNTEINPIFASHS